MKNVLKVKYQNEIKCDFSFRQGELWYFRLNEFETYPIQQDRIEHYNGKKPEDYPHFSDDYTTEPTFYDANASKMPVKCAADPQLEADISPVKASPRDLVFKTCRTLAGSQGFYECLLWQLEQLEAENEDLSDFWAQFEDCNDMVDVVLVLEC